MIMMIHTIMTVPILDSTFKTKEIEVNQIDSVMNIMIVLCLYQTINKTSNVDEQMMRNWILNGSGSDSRSGRNTNIV